MIEKSIELLWTLAEGAGTGKLILHRAFGTLLILQTCLFYLTTFPLSNIKTYLHLIKEKSDKKVKQILL